MGALFNDSVFGENEYSLCIPYRGQAMGNDNRCAVVCQFFQRLLDGTFAFVVEGAGRFVEDEDGRVFEEDAGDAETLLLST